MAKLKGAFNAAKSSFYTSDAHKNIDQYDTKRSKESAAGSASVPGRASKTIQRLSSNNAKTSAKSNAAKSSASKSSASKAKPNSSSKAAKTAKTTSSCKKK